MPYSVSADFVRNSSADFGGGIGNSGKINNITAKFIGNTSARYAGGGYHSGTINTIIASFVGNTSTGNGSGFWNQYTINIIKADFIGNTGRPALYNKQGTINSLTGNFIGNTSDNYSGGIFNNGGTLTLSADSKDILFYSNKDNSGYNDIYQWNSSTLNLNAKEGKRIIFNGTIRGTNNANKININAVPSSYKKISRHCEDEVRRIQTKD